MAIEISRYKQKLFEEIKTLEDELKSVGRRNPANPADWEATPERGWDALPADENEVADSIEEFEENSAILKQLEIRYNEVKNALKRVEDGTYGICVVGGEEIEADRLEANPAATTCKKHMK
ncbi:MAG: TraR/DksA C4-type zinc finger protein [Candidatus Taylorbacteria bacterium]|nr:TraR/DksA C4-type zinc finger protein [Candidatus Taylorbacteria bacterium]